MYKILKLDIHARLQFMIKRVSKSKVAYRVQFVLLSSAGQLTSKLPADRQWKKVGKRLTVVHVENYSIIYE